MMYASNGGDKTIFQFWPLPGDPESEKRIPLTPDELSKVFSMYK